MHLTATITKAEIARLAGELTPLRIDLGRRRSVSFGRPAVVELVEGRGLRVRGNAKLTWEIAGLPLPLALRTWQILLVPSLSVNDGAYVLAFDPVLEALDFKAVPGFFDDKIIEAINEGVAMQRGKLAWDLSKLLSIQWPLPRRVLPNGVVSVTPEGVGVRVTPEDLRIEVAFEARLESDRTDAPMSLRSA